MYTPPAYNVHDPHQQHQLMRDWSFATLFCDGPSGPVATHLPMLVRPRGNSGKGTLLTHMARANPQWHDIQAGAQVLVVFPGPHAFVSVNWYDDNQTFPTWNYGAVHVTGPCRIETDPDALRHVLEETVATFDAPLGGTWQIQDVDPNKTNRLLHAIVGLTIDIETIDAKLKFNQDKPRKDRAQVADHLLKNPATAAAGLFMQGML